MRDEIALLWLGFRTAYMQHRQRSSSGADLRSLQSPVTGGSEHSCLFSRVLHDMSGFSGLEMIRRTTGFAQITDYDAAQDGVSQV